MTEQRLRGGVSGLSPEQMRTLYASSYTEAHRQTSRVGAMHRRQLMNSGGLGYGGVAPCADFSGTSQGGSGGPAVLARGPSGQYTVCRAGPVIATSADAFHVRTDFPLSALDPDDPLEEILDNQLLYKVAIRRLTRRSYAFTGASWDPATRKITLEGGQTFGSGGTAYAPKGPTGYDLMWITDAGTGGITGWFFVDPVETRNEAAEATIDTSIEVFLTPDASILNESAVVGDGSTGINGVLLRSEQVGFMDNAVWDNATKRLTAFNTFSGAVQGIFPFGAYTPGPDDTVEIVGGNGALLTSTRVVSKVSDYPGTADNDTIEVADEDLATDFSFTGATFNSGTGILTAGSGTPWANYTWKVGNKLLILSSSDGAVVNTYVRIDGRPAGDQLLLGGTGLPTNGATVGGNIGHVQALVWHRQDFEHYWLDPDQPWTNTSNPSGIDYSTLLIDAVQHPAGISWTPQQLDFFYVYVAGDRQSGALWPNGTKAAVVESDPEACPTLTAATTQYRSWPYFGLLPSELFFMQANGGVANVIAAKKGTQINHAFHGLYQLAPECFIAGDKVKFDTVMDVGYMGTPFFIEILVVFDFDPELHWNKGAYDVDGAPVLNSNRVNYRCVWFHTPVISRAGINPLRIQLEGKASFDQTIGAFVDTDTVSMQWCAKVQIGNQGGDGSQDSPPGFPWESGPTSKVLQPRLFDKNAVKWQGFQRWWLDHSRWSVLFKAEHPSRRGFPGYHANYPHEPFSTLTGNGRQVLGCWGSQPSLPATEAVAPWGPRFRIGSDDVEWAPGSTY